MVDGPIGVFLQREMFQGIFVVVGEGQYCYLDNKRSHRIQRFISISSVVCQEMDGKKEKCCTRSFFFYFIPYLFFGKKKVMVDSWTNGACVETTLTKQQQEKV